MKRRFRLTNDFIDSYLLPECSFNDLGCGAGMFTIAALEKGSHVNAIDFAETSLNTTLEAATRNNRNTKNLNIVKLDLRFETPPFANVTIAMGVAPYIEDVEDFLVRILSSTDVFCCNFIDQNHPLNWLRRMLPVLNVRKLYFHSPKEFSHIVFANGFSIISRV